MIPVHLGITELRQLNEQCGFEGNGESCLLALSIEAVFQELWLYSLWLQTFPSERCLVQEKLWCALCMCVFVYIVVLQKLEALPLFECRCVQGVLVLWVKSMQNVNFQGSNSIRQVKWNHSLKKSQDLGCSWWLWCLWACQCWQCRLWVLCQGLFQHNTCWPTFMSVS